MRDVQTAIARGVVSRVSVLREERRTREAQMLLDALCSDQGHLGAVPTDPEPFTAERELSERIELERARLLARVERRDAVRACYSILDAILSRVGPEAARPQLAGAARTRFLTGLAEALSSCGREVDAIRVTTFLLLQNHLSADPVRVRQALEAAMVTAQERSRIVPEFNNLAVRHTKLAYLAALEGSRDDALQLLDAAKAEATLALELRSKASDRGATSARLQSRTNLLSIEIETAALIEDLAERADVLARLRADATAILEESYALPGVVPGAKLLRASALGMVVFEQAVVARDLEDPKRARELAWTARAAIKPRLDLFRDDPGESLSLAVRYGLACRLSGSEHAGRALLRRTKDRLELFRPGSAAVLAIDELAR